MTTAFEPARSTGFSDRFDVNGQRDPRSGAVEVTGDGEFARDALRARTFAAAVIPEVARQSKGLPAGEAYFSVTFVLGDNPHEQPLGSMGWGPGGNLDVQGSQTRITAVGGAASAAFVHTFGDSVNNTSNMVFKLTVPKPDGE